MCYTQTLFPHLAVLQTTRWEVPDYPLHAATRPANPFVEVRVLRIGPEDVPSPSFSDQIPGLRPAGHL